MVLIMHFYKFYLKIPCICRCIRISSWQMNISPQLCAKRCILDARTKWMNFRPSDFLQWPNLMLASSNATIVLKENVLDLLKATMNSG